MSAQAGSFRPTRRALLRAGAAGGAALLVRVPAFAAARTGGRFAPNPWLRIGADGRVTLVVARSEMGQGARTALAMILVDELEAQWDSVAIEQASPGPDYTDMNTGGSDSVESGWRPLRQAAAAAREMLVAAAAKVWNVDAADCRAREGLVRHEASGRHLSYGRLAPLAAALPVPKEPRLKTPQEFRLVGTGVKRVDGPAIVSGRARYGFDVRLPGMLFAAMARSPVAGGTAARVDASAAEAIAGVRRVLRISNGVAVVAVDTWTALAGRDALRITWDAGKNAALTTEDLGRRLDEAAARPPAHVSRHEGDVDAALAGAATRLSATYRDGFCAHAPVEPGNATARFGSGRCEIWAPTQNPQRVQREAAQALGIPSERVAVNVTLIGGGFGRRLGADYAVEAAEVARAAGRPVQVVWSRRDEFEGDRLHPAGRVDLAAGLDASGRLVAWDHRFTTFHLSMFGPFDPNAAVEEPDVNPWGGYDNPYAVPSLRAAWTDVESPIHTGAWRSVFYPPNVFARESFVDEIAHRTGRDPLALRRELLEGEFAYASRRVDRARLSAVLDLAAEKAGWGSPPPARAGRRSGRGIAVNVYHGRTVLAHAADVSVGDAGDVRVHRIVTAADCGQVVNRLGIEGQVESGIAWGLSYALKSEVTIRDGRVVEASFRDFPVLRCGEMPEVEVHLVASDRPPTGFGEPVPPVAPAVANAIFAATGRRARRLPIRPADLTGPAEGA